MEEENKKLSALMKGSETEKKKNGNPRPPVTWKENYSDLKKADRLGVHLSVKCAQHARLGGHLSVRVCLAGKGVQYAIRKKRHTEG